MGGFPAFLVGIYPKLLWALLGGWLLTTPSAVRRFHERLARAKPWTGAVLLACFALAAYLRLRLAPANQVLYDEFEHLDISRHLAGAGVFAQTLIGGLPGWDVLAAPTWPGAHHAALAVFMRFAGPSTAVAAAWSGLLSALTVPLVFWAALEIFDDERGALAAAAAWATWPLALKYAAACDLTSSSIFWTAAALAGIHAVAATGDDAVAAFAGLSLALACQTRLENALLLGYAAWVTRRLWVLAPASVGLLVGAGLALSNRAAGLPGFSADTTAPFVHLARQIGPNLRYLIAPSGFSLFILPGVLLSAKRPAVFKLALLSTAFLLVYSSFYRAKFAGGPQDRYALSVLLPLFLASAAGPARAALAVGLLAAGVGLFAPRAADSAAELRRLAAQAAPALPPRAFVLAFNPPAARELFSRPAAWPDLVLENPTDFAAKALAVGADGNFVFFRDWAWRARAEQAAKLEAAFLHGYDRTVIAEQGLDSVVLLTPQPKTSRATIKD
jgi:hypothetical protein